MSLSSRLAFLLACACAIASANVFAETRSPSLDEIRDQQVGLREDVQAGRGQFESMSATDRAALAERQSRLLAMIEGKHDASELDDGDQVAAFNLLQDINDMVNQVGDEKIVCQYIRKVGSHRKTKECKTVAERRAERDDSRREMERMMGGCPSAGCVGG